MQDYIILLVVVGVPILLGLMLRVNASHIFFSVMAGELLARYFGREAESALHVISNNTTVVSYAHLVIMTLPIVMTSVVLKNSISRSRAILNFFPLIVAGVVYAAFAVPLLPSFWQQQLQTSAVGEEFVRSTGAIIGFVVLFQLVVLWLMSRGNEGGTKKRKH